MLVFKLNISLVTLFLWKPQADILKKVQLKVSLCAWPHDVGLSIHREFSCAMSCGTRPYDTNRCYSRIFSISKYLSIVLGIFQVKLLSKSARQSSINDQTFVYPKFCGIFYLGISRFLYIRISTVFWIKTDGKIGKIFL